MHKIEISFHPDEGATTVFHTAPGVPISPDVIGTILASATRVICGGLHQGLLEVNKLNMPIEQLEALVFEKYKTELEKGDRGEQASLQEI